MNVKRPCHALLLLVSIVFVCHTQPATTAPQSSNEWQLVWSDEFDYNGLPDPKKWGYDVGGHGWGNKELQFYTERRKENARVENGHLIIEARREAWEGNEYTSARLVSKGKGDWTYGRFEVRAKLPSGLGTWPAIWMLPTQKDYGGWPSGGEIDIMEHVGFDPDVVHASVHTKSYHHTIGTQKTSRINVATARSAFNTYAVEWTPEDIRAFVNDKHFFTFKNERLTNRAADYKEWPFDKPFHLLLNIAVGGTWGGTKGVDQKIWPQRIEVDYVRVYQQKPIHKEAPKSAKAHAEADKGERNERRLQLINYLDGIAQKAVTIEPLEDRVRVLTEVSDAFWYLDKQRAIASFNQALQIIDNMASEAKAETPRIIYLRQVTLGRLAQRDAELAAKLLSNAPQPGRDDQLSREMNGMGTPYGETLMTVALTLLKTDLKQSVTLAQLALRDGMTQTARIYLQRLRELDPATADSLVELTLQHAVTRNPARLFDVLASWEYAFQPGAFYFGPIVWPKAADARTYEVSQSLQMAVLRFAVTAIHQNIQLRLNGNVTGWNVRHGLLYSVIEQLLPHIVTYNPAAAETLRAELSVLEQAIRSSGQALPALRSFGTSPEETSSAIDNLMYRAERAGAGKERDGIYLQAAYRLLFENQFEKAALMASRIDELEMRNPITDVINFNWTGSLLAKGQTTEALALARNIGAQEPRLVALAKIGGMMATKDAVVAGELMNESQTLAGKATPSPVVSAAVLNIALSRARQRDVTRAFESLTLAVSILNKTKTDTFWQMLNAQTSATPLKVALLRPEVSPSGHFTGITVGYPRLAGLTEVFTEASRNDLHQTMRVAQEFSSKTLSLALQAGICRSEAEQLLGDNK